MNGLGLKYYCLFFPDSFLSSLLTDAYADGLCSPLGHFFFLARVTERKEPIVFLLLNLELSS